MSFWAFVGAVLLALFLFSVLPYILAVIIVVIASIGEFFKELWQASFGGLFSKLSYGYNYDEYSDELWTSMVFTVIIGLIVWIVL